MKSLSEVRSPWLAGGGPVSDVVVSTRIRLARNLEAYPFASRMSPETAREILRKVERAVEELRREGHAYRMYELGELPPLVRELLVEKHLISPQHARTPEATPEGRALVVREDEVVAVMVNEEDHLRLQCLLPGFQLQEAWKTASEADDLFEGKLDYAFSPRYGYLTACPTNAGTGLRASCMLHLPGIVLTRQAESVFGELSKLGVAVRGLYGEGTEARANLFQVSNQVTLGQPEGEMLSHLQGIAQQLVERERLWRQKIYREQRWWLEDRVWRAYGILAHARRISSQEAMSLLSDLKLGVDLGVLELERPVFPGLLVEISPAYLQVREGRSLDPEERDERRAALIRRRVKIKR